MNALLMVVGLGVFGLVARMAGWSRGRRRPADLGFVSHQWLAEHRLQHP